MKKILGIPIALFIVGLLVIGGATASLVSYLSNEVAADVTVDSPMEQWILDGSDWVQGPISMSIYGGESTIIYVKTQNKADVAITGNGENIVTNPLGLTCNDFESVVVSTNTNNAGYGPEYDLIALPLCSEDGGYKVIFSYGPTPITWDAGQIDINKIVVTFKANALGTYTFTSEIVPIV